jgi:hypothetical protein
MAHPVSIYELASPPGTRPSWPRRPRPRSRSPRRARTSQARSLCRGACRRWLSSLAVSMEVDRWPACDARLPAVYALDAMCFRCVAKTGIL